MCSLVSLQFEPFITMTSEVEGGAETGSWEFLPEHPLVLVFSYLSPHDRLQAALTCKTWSYCLQHPLLWRRFVCRFSHKGHKKMLQAMSKDGHRIHTLVVEVQQKDKENRSNACQALHSLAENEQRRLNSFTLRFVGENPLAYSGADFVTELDLLFGCGKDKSEPFSYLTHIDLSEVMIVFESSLIDVLSENQPQLEFLNIQNKTLLCKVHPDCIHRLMLRCRKLQDLYVINVSLSDEVLMAIASLEEPCLEHLSIAYRRETKFTLDLSSEAWSALVKKIPKLQVTLTFDHNCPLDRIIEMLKPEIPVKVLRLETFTTLHEQLNLATTYYHKTLEKVVINSIDSSKELGQALLRLAENSPRLQVLLVYCVVDKEVGERILELLPEMKCRGSYILKWEKEAWPWRPTGDVQEDFDNLDLCE